MRAFVRRRGRYVAELDPTERSILAGVIADTATLLGDPPRDLAPGGPGQEADDGAHHGPAGPDAGAGPGTDEGSHPDSAAVSGGGGSAAANGPEDAGATGDEDDAAEGMEEQLARLGQDVPEPADPALARLLPAASRDDPELAAEFRRLTQDELRNDKIARLRMVWAALRAPGTKLTVPPEEAMDWAAAMTDVRLVLSERLGIRSDADAEEIYALSTTSGRPGSSEEEDLRLALASVYSAFTWLQESLVQVMLPTLQD
ncbi:DUF2017 domain-containing protein [Pseudactinotalea sp. Z1739]|uniref:DUF2017 domain-containing protein n=1 Tax=Pseudactinotalea sp. Z1739 TaxID=3413028 RepID=UPI003C7BA70C